MTNARSGIPDSAIVALNQGQKLEAIKLVRESTGLGLKEAKEAVEAYIASQPHLQEQFASAGRGRWSGCLVLVIILAGILYFAFGR